MIEGFVGDITDKRIRRDCFTSVADLGLAIDLSVCTSPITASTQTVHLDVVHPGQSHADESLACRPMPDKCRTEWRTKLAMNGDDHHAERPEDMQFAAPETPVPFAA